jgi:endonuclease YncB( thermonuclease family)
LIPTSVIRAAGKVKLFDLLRYSIFISILVAGIPLSVRAVEPIIVGTAGVVDGDTIEIRGAHIRLHGIDAPESRQVCNNANGEPWRCGQSAALALSNKTNGKIVQCFPRGQDRYLRTVAICHLDGEDIGRWMVAEGWAVAYRRYSMDYVAEENGAKERRVGVWSGPFEMPWEWRARRFE